MSQLIQLSDLKSHLNIEVEFIDDDLLLQNYIDVAEVAVTEYLNGAIISPETIAKPIKQAIILLASHFYLNRGLVSFAQGYEMPYSFQFLLNPYRILAIQ